MVGRGGCREVVLGSRNLPSVTGSGLGDRVCVCVGVGALGCLQPGAGNVALSQGTSRHAMLNMGPLGNPQ